MLRVFDVYFITSAFPYMLKNYAGFILWKFNFLLRCFIVWFFVVFIMTNQDCSPPRIPLCCRKHLHKKCLHENFVHTKNFFFNPKPFCSSSFSFFLFFCCFVVVARVTQRLKVIPVQPFRVIIFSLNDVVHDISRSNKTIVRANPTQRMPSNESPTKFSPAFTAVPSVSFKLFIIHPLTSCRSTPWRTVPTHMPHAEAPGSPFFN